MDTLVITATLGSRSTLVRTIESIKEFGGDRVKHILTCPQNEVKNLRVKFPFLEVVSEPEGKRGIYGALNSAILRFAKDYKYVTFLNDDDYWLPGFKDLFKALEENQELKAVYGRTLFVSENDKIMGEQTCSEKYEAFKVLLTKKIVLFTQQATLIKSDLFYQVGGFDETYKLIADSKFWVEAIDLKAKFCYIDTMAAAYTLQKDQLSSDKELQNKEYSKLLSEDIFDSVSLLDKAYEIVIFRFVNIRVYLKRYLKKLLN